jgi:aspartyl protease family protein
LSSPAFLDSLSHHVFESTARRAAKRRKQVLRKSVRSDRLLWIVIGGLVLAVVALIYRHEAGEVAGIDSDSFANLVYLLALALVIGSAAVAMFYGRAAEALRAVLFWAVLVAGLALGYAYRAELQAVADRLIAEFVPGYPVTRPGTVAVVEVIRAPGGEFNVRTEVNGRRIPMLVDTGASSVVLTPEAAKAAGLPVEMLRYDVPIETAKGRGRAASVVLDRVAVGNITERRVPALVSEPGDLKTSLLGMSFLNRLESFEVRGARLMLRGKGAKP